MTHKDLYWHHAITLLNGEKTAGRIDYSGDAGERYALPSDLRGKHVVDFGSCDGYWAIECKKRGASSVVASDLGTFPTAVMALGEYGISYLTGSSYDLDKSFSNEAISSIGACDLVLFYGVLYHLKNPIMGLLNAASCCKLGGTVIVESAINQGKTKNLPQNVPLIWLIDGPYAENDTNDASNYTMPNAMAVAQMCRMAGLFPTHDGFSACNDLRYTLVCEKKE